VTTRAFLLGLRAQDIRVWVEGDRLRVSAPLGALTDNLHAQLKARKPEIMSFLRTAAAPPSRLVAIQPSGTRPPFFAVPGHNGDVFCYVRLAQHLGGDQPFYAFEPPGVDGSQPPLTSIEALARLYVQDIRAFQANGPYLIGGYCMGGIVAFELARQLQQQGQEVALLVLFDSVAPSALWHRNRFQARLRYRRDQILRRLRDLQGQPWSVRFAFMRSRFARLAGRAVPAGAPDKATQRRQELKDRVAAATVAAALVYARRRRTYPGDIVHFLGSEESRRLAYGRQLDWARFARHVEVETGPDECWGDVMLREPHVRVFADLLRRRLDRAAASPAIAAHVGELRVRAGRARMDEAILEVPAPEATR
jgi:thioesterase domain-containing protein